VKCRLWPIRKTIPCVKYKYRQQSAVLLEILILKSKGLEQLKPTTCSPLSYVVLILNLNLQLQKSAALSLILGCTGKLIPSQWYMGIWWTAPPSQGFIELQYFGKCASWRAWSKRWGNYYRFWYCKGPATSSKWTTRGSSFWISTQIRKNQIKKRQKLFHARYVKLWYNQTLCCFLSTFYSFLTEKVKPSKRNINARIWRCSS